MKVKLETFVYDPQTKITTLTRVWEGKAERGCYGTGEFEVEVPQSALRALLNENARLVVEPE